MSATLVKESPATGAGAKFRPSISPVPVFDTMLSKIIAFARPGLMLSLLVLRFDSLVQDPVATLKASLPIVALLQVIYVVFCLPVAGSQTTKTPRKPRPGEKKKADSSAPNPVSSAILSLVLTAIATPVAYALFVLFGAPFLDHIPHTVLCAAHFSLLGLFPIFYSRGVDGEALTAVAGAAAPLDETFGGLVGAVIGAWLGAVPIPLDWDRDWQKWPVTVLVGMYVGSLLFSRLSGILFYGKRFSEAEDVEE